MPGETVVDDEIVTPGIPTLTRRTAPDGSTSRQSEKVASQATPLGPKSTSRTIRWVAASIVSRRSG